ncbi:hypothetical protein [Serinicoccus hydrothermalis]|uniref:hypothetical protein n=1 Tax=Serinicoccus hydrothermalis TaxID=1758689 RepID=UPI00082950F9|nr:hypothetical protein [Serinicoccus hydrothermalis]
MSADAGDLQGTLAPHLDEIVATLVRGQPAWIRVMFWVARLAEPDGSPAPAYLRLNRVVSWVDGAAVATYGKAFGLSDELRAVDDKTATVPWTQLRLVADRDGQRELRLVDDEPRRQFDDSASDPYWRQVHDYLDLNRDQVDALVERLRASGDLPVEEKRSGRGLLSLFRHRRGQPSVSTREDSRDG